MAAATLAVLLVFGTASAVLADANNQIDYGALPACRPDCCTLTSNTAVPGHNSDAPH
jgi:hypothetical protein